MRAHRIGEAGAERSARVERAGMIALVICAAYVVVLAVPVHLHIVTAFSDFYRFYASDADRMAAGAPPENTFNPPGYPVLLLLASPLTTDRFTAGKWISLLAGGLSGAFAFYLHRRLFGATAALVAVLILLTAETFTSYAISGMTDVPFLCLCLAAMLLITDGRGGWRRAVLGGVLCGAACLIRYNGAFLLVPGLTAMIWPVAARQSRARRAAAYLGGFALTIAPWVWWNYALHGSPVYASNYIDVAKALGLDGPGRSFTSLAGLVSSAPLHFARSYVAQVGRTLVNTLGASIALFPVGPLAVLGVALCLSQAQYRRRPALLVLVGALAFLLFMSLTHWERRYHLFMLAGYSGFAALGLLELARGIGRVFDSSIARHVAATALILWIAVPSLYVTARKVSVTLERQPIELLPAAQYLDRMVPPRASVMAVRAQIAYLSRRPWLELPPVSSVDELKAALRARPADYVVYDRWGRGLVPGLAVLGEPDGGLSWLERVYRDPGGGVAIYAVRLDGR